MWELCVHPDYDHLFISLTSKKGKFQSQTNISQGIIRSLPPPPKKTLIFPVSDLITTGYQIEKNLFYL